MIRRYTTVMLHNYVCVYVNMFVSKLCNAGFFYYKIDFIVQKAAVEIP